MKKPDPHTQKKSWKRFKVINYQEHETFLNTSIIVGAIELLWIYMRDLTADLSTIEMTQILSAIYQQQHAKFRISVSQNSTRVRVAEIWKRSLQYNRKRKCKYTKLKKCWFDYGTNMIEHWTFIYTSFKLTPDQVEHYKKKMQNNFFYLTNWET